MCPLLLVGVGTWHLERSRTLRIIKNKIELRGEERFFVPDAGKVAPILREYRPL